MPIVESCDFEVFIRLNILLLKWDEIAVRLQAAVNNRNQDQLLLIQIHGMKDPSINESVDMAWRDYIKVVTQSLLLF